MKDLKIIVPNNFSEFGRKVNEHIKTIRNTDENFIINAKFERFNNGEGKVYILCPMLVTMMLVMKVMGKCIIWDLMNIFKILREF